MRMTITCSNCGKHRRIGTNCKSITRAIESGWGSYGAALYCRECSRTWHERNEKDMADIQNTYRLISDMIFREHERAVDQ